MGSKEGQGKNLTEERCSLSWFVLGIMDALVPFCPRKENRKKKK